MSGPKVIEVSGGLVECLKAMSKDSDSDGDAKLPTEGIIARLRDDAAILDDVTEFKAGDLVDWKHGSDHLYALDDGPYLFRRYLKDDEKHRANDNPATPYWTEVNDCIIGVMMRPGNGKYAFCEIPMSARRLRPYGQM